MSFSLFSHSSYARSEEEEGQDPEREEAEQDDVDIGVKHTRDMSKIAAHENGDLT